MYDLHKMCSSAFDNPHVALYWLTWPCLVSFTSTILANESSLAVAWILINTINTCAFIAAWLSFAIIYVWKESKGWFVMMLSWNNQTMEIIKLWNHRLMHDEVISLKNIWMIKEWCNITVWEKTIEFNAVTFFTALWIIIQVI